jgi:two-component system KDP operon response regulator KdpE
MQPGPLVLVADDEPHIAQVVRINLEAENFQVITAASGTETLKRVREDLPDLVLLDVGMPELDGFETLRLLRELSDIPVVMLTVRSSEDDIVRGLGLGADDYITKPFRARELSSRIKAVLRRTAGPAEPESAILKVDDYLSVDYNSREAIVDGKRVKLRPTEFRLLFHLIENAGWVVPHETLLSKVWGYEYRDEVHYVRLYVTYLRQKIEPDPSNPRYILTERGTGYRFIDFRERTTDREQNG